MLREHDTCIAVEPGMMVQRKKSSKLHSNSIGYEVVESPEQPMDHGTSIHSHSSIVVVMYPQQASQWAHACSHHWHGQQRTTTQTLGTDSALLLTIGTVKMMHLIHDVVVLLVHTAVVVAVVEDAVDTSSVDTYLPVAFRMHPPR
jgi:hypothetical protein